MNGDYDLTRAYGVPGNAGLSQAYPPVTQPYAGESAQKAPAFTDQLQERLNYLQATLAEVFDSLTALSDRVLGPQPSPVSGSQAGANGPMPSVSVSILAQLDLLNTGAGELARRASVLNHRI